ncbi:Uncharacterized protein Adt_01479 [Abeliophyllum distichum]|uniref:Uncharacterized protein n=1 Tax=Abeliophyllum distichum TaxID=126358 RepID=A0ABD1VTC1_9LAMI
MVTLTWMWHQGSWIKVVKRHDWILNWVVSGTFADLHQDPGPQHHLARNGRVKVLLNTVPAEAVAEARVPAEVEAGVSLGNKSLWFDMMNPDVLQESATCYEQIGNHLMRVMFHGQISGIPWALSFCLWPWLLHV